MPLRTPQAVRLANRGRPRSVGGAARGFASREFGRPMASVVFKAFAGDAHDVVFISRGMRPWALVFGVRPGQ